MQRPDHRQKHATTYSLTCSPQQFTHIISCTHSKGGGRGRDVPGGHQRDIYGTRCNPGDGGRRDRVLSREFLSEIGAAEAALLAAPRAAHGHAKRHTNPHPWYYTELTVTVKNEEILLFWQETSWSSSSAYGFIIYSI